MEQMSDRSDHFEQYLVSIALASHKVCTLLTRVQSHVKHLFPRACVSACEHPGRTREMRPACIRQSAGVCTRQAKPGRHGPHRGCGGSRQSANEAKPRTHAQVTRTGNSRAAGHVFHGVAEHSQILRGMPRSAQPGDATQASRAAQAREPARELARPPCSHARRRRALTVVRSASV